MDQDSERAYRAQALTAEISKLLAGKGSAVVGAALADLTSMWLAAHYPAEAREPLLQGWLETVRELVPVSEKQNLERYGFLGREPS